MASDVRAIMKLEVPMIVVLAQRQLSVNEVVALVPGSIIELPKEADDELELLVNNKPIGSGRAVKVGENFGLRLVYVGDVRQRIAALAPAPPPSPAEPTLSPEELAEQMLAGQT